MSLTLTRPSIPVPLPLSRGGLEATTSAGGRATLELGDLALLTAPGGTTTFLRADKTWAVPAGGGGGGDLSSNTALSVDSELAVFSGTTGKLVKRGTGSGLALLTNGVLSIKAAPAGAVVGTTDTQTLTGKTIAGVSNTLSIREADLALSDLTTADVSTARHGLLPKAPGGTTLFFRADATWATPAGGGGGGDVSSNSAVSVEGELALFTGTTGKLLKRSGSTGLAKVTAGVMGTVFAPTGTVVGTTDAQTLTGKTISGADNTLAIREADLLLTDVTTRDVSLSQHGFVPKAPGGSTLFLRGDATWAAPAGGGGGAPTDAEYITSVANASLSLERVLADSATITWDRSVAGQITANAIGGGGYTDEQAQDAIGAMLLDTATIDFTYTDATPSLSASVIDGSITEAKLSLSDVTTKDASTTAHGLLRKLSGTATQYLDGSGAWTTPAGGTNYWSRTVSPPSYQIGLLAWWKLEEASGNRLDSVGANHLVPQGTVATITNAAGKIGNAVAMNGTAGTYLSVADNATFSAGPNMSFTVTCWVYVTTTGSNMGFVGKGGSTPVHAMEYQLWQASGQWYFYVGTGSSSVGVASSFTPVINQWCLLIGWYDHVADLQYFQVNNGTPVQSANANGSYDSALPFEVGRQAGHATASLNGRVDMVGFWKRVLTAQERTDLWNGGAGLDYPSGSGAGAYVAPATATDSLLLGATRVTTERLEVDGAITVGTTTGTTDGTLRWSGTDFEGRKGGAWVTLTAAAGQPLDATLTALAGLATGANQLPYAIGTDAFAQTTLSAFARTLLDDADAATMRGTLALGTMAQQDSHFVSITGGNIVDIETLTADPPTLVIDPTNHRVGVGTFSPGHLLDVAGLVLVQSRLYLGSVIGSPAKLEIQWPRASEHGIALKPSADTGANATLLFHSSGGVTVGSITQTASATAYNTSSDVRLKHAITPLTGALDVVRALDPITYLWKADDSPGVGFSAHEVAEVVDGVVTGEKDAVDAEGNVQPQQIDLSKLVPWLTAGLKDALAVIDTLAQRVASLETQLGV